MPQFMISVCHPDEYDQDPDWSDPELQRRGAQVGALNEEMQRQGVWVFAAGLQPASTATTLRRSGEGDVSMTDGPYAETKEQVGGFWVIDVPDLDTALEWSRRCVDACEEEAVELRPMQDG